MLLFLCSTNWRKCNTNIMRRFSLTIFFCANICFFLFVSVCGGDQQILQFRSTIYSRSIKFILEISNIFLHCFYYSSKWINSSYGILHRKKCKKQNSFKKSIIKNPVVKYSLFFLYIRSKQHNNNEHITDETDGLWSSLQMINPKFLFKLNVSNTNLKKKNKQFPFIRYVFCVCVFFFAFA